MKGVEFIWQCGLTPDGGAPALVACDVLDHQPHICGVVGVEVSLQFLLMSLLCLLDAYFQSCSGSVYLSPDRKAAFLALDRALTSPFIQTFWLGNDFSVFVIITLSNMV